MKKTLMIAAAAAFVVAGGSAAVAGPLSSCKACHKGSPGPKFTDIKAAYAGAYGADAEAKLTAFLQDVADNGKKGTVPPSIGIAKYEKKVKMMRGQGKKVKKVGAAAAAAAIMAK